MVIVGSPLTAIYFSASLYETTSQNICLLFELQIARHLLHMLHIKGKGANRFYRLVDTTKLSLKSLLIELFIIII